MNDKIEVFRTVLGPINTNCYVVVNQESKESVIIDPGDSADVIVGLIGQEGLAVKAVLLTHGHWDHIMAAEELRDRYNVPIMALDREEKLLASSYDHASGDYGRKTHGIIADRYLHDGEELDLAGLKWKVISTPGHSAGSCCYYIEEEKILFCGDTLFEGSYGRFDLYTGDGEAIAHSLTQILFRLPEDTTAYPGHGRWTTIEKEKKSNPILLFAI